MSPQDRFAGDQTPPMDDPDAEALALVLAGELSALETLYDRYKTLAFSLALRITGDGSLAEDVVQEAFLGAWRNAGRYAAGRGSIRTWLLSIVHHRAIDAVRRRRPVAELPEGDEAPPPTLTLPDVWAEVAGRLDREAIASAMARISQVQREVLELAYYGGLTQQEIAERTGAPLGTVKSRARLGLLALREELSGSGSASPAGGAG